VAKKAKTPRPPVQAPRRRETKRERRGVGSIPRAALIAGAVALAAIVAAVAFALSGGGGGSGSSAVQGAMDAAGCKLREVAPLPPKSKANYHADSPKDDTKVKWSTSPPSAGGHYGLWAVWGFYRSDVAPQRVVHNLEHGGVAIWWGPKVPAATVDQLESFYRESPDAMFGTPYADLGDKIALTAWTGDPDTYYRDGDYGTGHIAVCPKFDEKAFAAFRSAYRGKGPEGIETSDNKQGTGPQ